MMKIPKMNEVLTSIQVSFKKLNYVQKVVMFLYVVFNIYRGVVSSPIFFLSGVLPFFYLFLIQQRRVKGFLRLRQRDTRVRLKHFRDDFYYAWLFINISFVFIGVCLLTMYYFEFVKNYLLSIGIVFPLTIENFKNYTWYYFLFVITLDWFINMYIIWFKNTKTFFQFLASQEVTLKAGFASYFGLQSFVNMTQPEVNPRIHYFYHSFDVFGRGYHFHTGHQIVQSNIVKGVLGERYNPKFFLDETNYFSEDHFLGFVWANRLEIGAKLTEDQKSKFPSWIQWSPDAALHESDPTVLKDTKGNIIGQIRYDSKNRLVPKFYPTVVLEPLYRPADFDGPDSFDKEFTISGSVLNSSHSDESEERIPIISPVVSEESADSSVASAGELIVPSSNVPFSGAPKK